MGFLVIAINCDNASPWLRVWRLEILPKVLSLIHRRTVFTACHIRYILLLQRWINLQPQTKVYLVSWFTILTVARGHRCAQTRQEEERGRQLPRFSYSSHWLNLRWWCYWPRRRRRRARWGRLLSDVVRSFVSNRKGQYSLNIMYHDIYRCKNQLRKIIRAVRSSPQRRQAWLAEVTISLKRIEQALRNTALMLIPDVKTWWSSTHQMLRKQANLFLLTSRPIHSLYLCIRSCTRLLWCYW